MSDTDKPNEAPPQVQAAPASEAGEATAASSPQPTSSPEKPSDRSSQKRAQMLANLEKGRKTALENRRKKALLKKLEKEQKQQKLESDLKQRIMNKEPSVASHPVSNNSSNDMRNELKDLRRELAALKSSDRTDGLKDKQIAALKDEMANTKAQLKQFESKPLVEGKTKPSVASPAVAPPKPKPLQVPETVAELPPKPEPIVYSTFKRAPW